MMAAQLIYDGKPSRRKFHREELKIGVRKPFGRKPQWMGDIEDGVSHFLCPDHQAWLPRQQNDVILADKQNTQQDKAEAWHQGLKDGTYRNRADIARVNGCSRAWVSRLLNEHHGNFVDSIGCQYAADSLRAPLGNSEPPQMTPIHQRHVAAG